MRTRSLHAFILPLLLSFAGCQADVTGSSGSNLPAVGNARNSFGFSVRARTLDLDQSYPLSFDADSVSVGLAVVGYGAGSAEFQLLDASGQVLYSRDLGANTAEGNASLAIRRPAAARVRFSGYSGIVAIGVGGK
jgi:hypothetical protein